MPPKLNRIILVAASIAALSLAATFDTHADSGDSPGHVVYHLSSKGQEDFFLPTRKVPIAAVKAQFPGATVVLKGINSFGAKSQRVFVAVPAGQAAAFESATSHFTPTQMKDQLIPLELNFKANGKVEGHRIWVPLSEFHLGTDFSPKRALTPKYLASKYGSAELKAAMNAIGVKGMRVQLQSATLVKSRMSAVSKRQLRPRSAPRAQRESARKRAARTKAPVRRGR